MARSGTWILVGILNNVRGWVWRWLRVQPLDSAWWYFGGEFEFREVTNLWIVNAAARWQAWWFGRKNLNFEKRLTWTIWRSDGKLVLVNAAARWRVVNFWFRVSDRRSDFPSYRRAWESSREMVHGGISPTRFFNLFQREIWILTANSWLTAENLNFKGTSVSGYCSGKENHRPVILISPQKADPCIRVRTRPVRLSRRPRAVLAEKNI